MTRQNMRALSNLRRVKKQCYFFGVTLTTKRACLCDNLNPDFCFALYLTGVHFQDELQHVGDVSQQKIKYRPI